MSVIKVRTSELPKDAIIITREQALTHQLEIIHNWPRFREVWPFKFGISVLGLAGSLTGIYLNSYFRRKLKLRKLGLVSTYMPIIVLPGMVSALVHRMFITNDIVTEMTECLVCLQTQAMALQGTVGFIYPLVLAPLGNYMHATRHATLRLPNILSDFSGSIRQLIKFGRPIGTQLSVIFIGHLLLASWFTYKEAWSYHTVKEQMMKLEYEYEHNRIEIGKKEN